MAARRAALGDLSNVGADAAAQGGVKWDPPPNVRVTRGMRQRALAAEQASAQQPSAGAEPMSVDNAMPPAAAGTALDLAPDPQQCNQYVKDIYGHLRVLEGEFRVSPHFMQSQRDINATMRGILIDWLVEVAEEYRLVPETLHLSVNYIDRFLAQARRRRAPRAAAATRPRRRTESPLTRVSPTLTKNAATLHLT